MVSASAIGEPARAIIMMTRISTGTRHRRRHVVSAIGEPLSGNRGPSITDCASIFLPCTSSHRNGQRRGRAGPAPDIMIAQPLQRRLQQLRTRRRATEAGGPGSCPGDGASEPERDS